MRKYLWALSLSLSCGITGAYSQGQLDGTGFENAAVDVNSHKPAATGDAPLPDRFSEPSSAGAVCCRIFSPRNLDFGRPLYDLVTLKSCEAIRDDAAARLNSSEESDREDPADYRKEHPPGPVDAKFCEEVCCFTSRFSSGGVNHVIRPFSERLLGNCGPVSVQISDDSRPTATETIVDKKQCERVCCRSGRKGDTIFPQFKNRGNCLAPVTDPLSWLAEIVDDKLCNEANAEADNWGNLGNISPVLH
jgi:hypothetical protein